MLENRNALIAKARDLYLVKKLTVREIAKRLNISRSAVHRFVEPIVTPERRWENLAHGRALCRDARIAHMKEHWNKVRQKKAEEAAREAARIAERTRPTTSAAEQIAEFIATKGITKCPTKYLAPTQAALDISPESSIPFDSSSMTAASSSTSAMKQGDWGYRSIWLRSSQANWDKASPTKLGR